MALFRFEALDHSGNKIDGVIDAESILEAKNKILKQGVFLVRVELLNSKGAKPFLNKKEVLNFTRELARLLKAGLPLYEALATLEEKYRGQKTQRILLDLCEQVKMGHSFSFSLSRHPKTFDVLYVAMIANAERTGRLSSALEELTQLLIKQRDIRRKIVGALLYPSLLFGFCFFVLGALLFYVVPSLQELFDGRDLHSFTKFVFSLSSFACNNKLYLLGGVIGFAIFIFMFLFHQKWKKILLRLILHFPFITHLLLKVALIRFFRAAATLLDGGVPILSAIAQARGTIHHPLLEDTILQSEKSILQGETIHKSFSKNSLIPSLVPRLLGIAEKGGNLEGMMRQIAEIYEEDLDRILSHFSTVAQPILLLLLGTIVGFVLLSVLLPLTDVSSFAS